MSGSTLVKEGMANAVTRVVALARAGRRMFSEKPQKEMKKIATEVGVFTASGLIFLIIAHQIVYRRAWPINDKWPMFIAPTLTFGVGFLTCSQQILYCLRTPDRHLSLPNKNKIAVLSLFTILVLFGICFWLVGPHLAFGHLLVVLFLFSYFLVWDNLMMKWMNDGDRRSEIKITNRLINLPTWAGLFVIVILTQLHSMYELGHLLDDIFKRAPIGEIHSSIRNSLILTEADAFISGAIALHLAITAVAYLIGTHFGIGLEERQENEPRNKVAASVPAQNLSHENEPRTEAAPSVPAQNLSQ